MPDNSSDLKIYQIDEYLNQNQGDICTINDVNSQNLRSVAIFFFYNSNVDYKNVDICVYERHFFNSCICVVGVVI